MPCLLSLRTGELCRCALYVRPQTLTFRCTILLSSHKIHTRLCSHSNSRQTERIAVFKEIFEPHNKLPTRTFSDGYLYSNEWTLISNTWDDHGWILELSKKERALRPDAGGAYAVMVWHVWGNSSSLHHTVPSNSAFHRIKHQLYSQCEIPSLGIHLKFPLELHHWHNLLPPHVPLSKIQML